MIYEKEITKNEREILSLIDELGLSSITVPYKIKGNRLIMQKGYSFSYMEGVAVDIIRLYQQCLEPLYKYKNNTFSLGIYGIFRSKSTECSDVDYYQYLNKEVNNIINELAGCLIPELALIYENVLELFQIGLSKYNKYFKDKTNFELLHGDLFIGNILLYNNRYVLIDFEYMRFGPKISEISFLLLWDIISIPQMNRRALFLNDEIEMIKINKIISDIESEIIKKVYIPLYLVLICLYISAGRYRDSEIIKKGVMLFYENYYNLGDKK